MKQLYISFFLFFISQKIISQPWIPLGSNEQTSDAISLTAASTFFVQVSNDGVPYVSYIDDAGGANNLGDFRTHAKRFKNGQWEFAGNAISPQFPGSDDFPIALDGNVPYVAYSEAFTPVDIQNKLSVKRLNSVTGNWDIVGQQGLSDGAATGTVIAADNGKIYVAYNDGAANGKITVKRFDNANPANGWQTVGPSGFSNGFILGTSLVIDDGIPYVSYLDFGDNLVYVKKFNGAAWEDVGTNNPSGGLQVVVSSLKFNSVHTPFITFIDATGAGVVRNLNTANAWVTTGGQPFTTTAENTLSLAILHDIPFVAFGKKDNNNVIQVNVKRFNPSNNDWQDVGNQPVTASPFSINNTALTIAPGNKLLLVFRNFNLGIYAKTFDVAEILPVTLTTFTVSRQNNKNLLQWHTANELNNRLFEIEHGTDATAFTRIGEVPAQLPADIPHDYSFIDAAPSNGMNFYRLKQVDIDGNFTYSNIISILFNQEQRSFISLFPNPVRDVLHTGYSTEGQKEIIIRNVEGKEIKRVKSAARSVDINVTDLPAGTYFISLYGDKIIETRSFVK
jgi:hypothetical protein